MTFKAFAKLTRQIAAGRTGADSPQAAIDEAWTEVGFQSSCQKSGQEMST